MMREEIFKECSKIWDKYNLEEKVRKHCIAVSNLAEKIGVATKADVELIITGSLLHDIGRAVTHDPFLHFIESGKILRNERFDEGVVRIAERHFSCGISKEEAEKFGLPPGNYIPETMEEKIVSFADNLVFGARAGNFEEFLRRLDEIALNNRDHAWFVKRTKERALRMKEEVEKISGLKF
ncbi:MAG TPA: TIGR00295 family protein [Archaeoglobaceae archaeon]|nr:TIGR00295 family protein [Archaeoglobaceae archaeon]